jgi:hypothetical protein
LLLWSLCFLFGKAILETRLLPLGVSACLLYNVVVYFEYLGRLGMVGFSRGASSIILPWSEMGFGVVS